MDITIFNYRETIIIEYRSEQDSRLMTRLVDYKQKELDMRNKY